MKQLYFSFGLFFLAINAFSQNYALLNEDAKAIYALNKYSALMDHNHFGNTNNDWISAQRKTVAIVNGDTLIRHASMAKSQEYNLGNNCLVIGDTSWLGVATIIQSSGDYLFFNRFGDTIRLLPQAQLNDTWTAFEWQNGDYIEATVFNISLETIANVSDSVKSIVFQVKNVAHQNVSHHFNGFQMSISKNYGMVKSVNFFDFPIDTSSVILIGHSDLNTSIKNITTADIYNFDVGDEFHVEGFSQDIPNAVYFSYEIQRILSKSIAGDSMIYDIESQRININRTFNPTQEDTIYTTDTIVKLYLVDGSNLLDSLPYTVDTVKYNIGSFYYSPRYVRLEWSAAHNNRLAKVTMGDGYQILPCISPLIDAFPCQKQYIEGLGGGYYDCTSWGNSSTKELVFYKKNTGTWGTPINIQSLIPTSTVQLKVFQSIAVFPNPATSIVTISTKNEIIQDGQMMIFNGLGKLVLSSSIHHFQEKKLDVNSWASGIYYIQIQSKEGVWAGRFVKQ